MDVWSAGPKWIYFTHQLWLIIQKIDRKRENETISLWFGNFVFVFSTVGRLTVLRLRKSDLLLIVCRTETH